MMDEQIRKELWEELKLLQPTIDKFDRFTFQIKNWFLTIFSAFTGYAVVNVDANLLWINFAIILVFYAYETTYRISHGAFLKRSREIEDFLRKNENMADTDKPPNLGKHLFTGIKNVSSKNWLYRLQRKIHVEGKRAKRNVYEFKLFYKEFVSSLFQFRVSSLYLLVALLNGLAIWLVYTRHP